MSIYRVRIRGALACFSRPEFSTERVTYDVITPSAARGAIEAVLWKPAIRWHIRKIMLLAPPQYIQFKRNEVATRTSVRNAQIALRAGQPYDYYADEDRAQRNTIALRDVDYAVEAEFVMTQRRGPDDNPAKFDAMFQRRLEKGQFHMQPYLGCREFPAIVEPYTGSPEPLASETRDLGYMLHDLRFGPDANRPVFFRARIERGVIEVPEWQEAA
ncbi:MAG: type I-C CRISPR-associated protein Cas5c [Bryobacteraceae bacterium]